MTGMGLGVLMIACTRPETAPPPPAEEPPSAVATDTAAPVATDPQPSTFSGQNAYKHVQHLAVTIGSRPTGSPKEVEAAAYIAGELRRYGYTVEKQPFDFDAYRARSATLEVQGVPEQARPIEFSPGGEVSGRLVPAGIGRSEEFPRGTISGQVALIERGTLSFGDKVENAKAAGAAAVVVYNNVSGDFAGWTLPSIGAIPALAVSRETGLKLLQSSFQVRVSVDARYRKIESQNVVAKGGQSCRIVVGGHFDSVEAGPGANDNASGTGVTMELARVLKDRAAADGLCFIAFGAEELGLWGSRRYAESLTEEQKRAMAGMINLDMVGVGDSWRMSGSEALQAPALSGAASSGLPVGSFGTNERGGGSDHASFMREGIPAVFIHRREDPNYHTAEDKVEHVDPAALEAAGMAAVSIIDRLAKLSP